MAEAFHPLSLPEHLRRDSVLKPQFRPKGYLDALDRETLWYDAFWRDGKVTVVGPPLNNLRAGFRRAEFALDGTPAKLWRMRRYKRHFVAQVLAEEVPKRIAVTLDGWTGDSAVAADGSALFAGLNTAFYVNRNNDLHWMRDHAAWHVQEHGMQGLIVVDNGSDAYAPKDIRAALKPVGLRRVLVLPAPFKYGPVGLKPFRRTEKYMQTALFNVLRMRFLGQAAGVLNCDIDELVVRRGGRGVFEAAQDSRIGFVQIGGIWVYGPPGSDGPCPHRAHVHAHQPPRPAPPKFCIAPSGPLGRSSWDIHGIERLPFLRQRLHPEFFFLHCRGVSTGWKGAGRLRMPEDTAPHDEAAAALARMP